MARILVSAGFARVKVSKNASEEQEELALLEGQALSAQLGIFGSDPELKFSYQWLQEDPREFLSNWKGTPIPAVIDQVKDGSSFRAWLYLADGKVQSVNLSLSGIQAPIIRKNVPNMDDITEPFAEEAKYFVECRILQRNVHVLLESITGQGTGLGFFGTIKHPKGNISELLLQEGYAKIIDWNLSIVQNPQSYKAAEQKAHSEALRIWKNKVTSQPVSNGIGTEFQATVIRILGPDMLLVDLLKTPGIEKKISLSSIRGPKRTKNEAGMETGYCFEAQEFLRSRLIGSKIMVKIDYVKPAEGEYEKRYMATVSKNDKNIALLLIQKGLGNVIKHKKDDHNRSSHYDALLQAEEEAITQEKGIFNLKELPIHRIIDASENIAKAKSFFPQLQRHGSLKGIVEYVWSGSRFKIWIPTQNCRLTFILAGIKTPRPPGGQQKGEEYGIEAAKFSNSRILQREVEISVEGHDKVGGFIGSLSFSTTPLAALLVEAGLSTVHSYSASQSPIGNQLFAAEQRAKDAKLCLWANYTQAEETLDETAALSLTDSKAKEAIISEVGKGGKLYLQYLGPELQSLEKLMVEFATHHQSAGQSAFAPFVPNLGDYCSAQYTADKQWYRAQVLKADQAQNMYHVIYVDYGNSELIQGSRLRHLPSNFGISKLKAQAVQVSLGLIELPLDSEFAQEAHEALCHYTEGITFNVVLLGRVNPVPVLLFNKNGISVQEQMIREGLVYISKNTMTKYQQEVRLKLKSVGGRAPASKSDLETLVAAQEATARERVFLLYLICRSISGKTGIWDCTMTREMDGNKSIIILEKL